MRTALTIIAVLMLNIFTGCGGAIGGRELLTVDFQEAQTLRYKFVSSRDVELDWDPTKVTSKPGKSTITKLSESMEMVVAYTPIEINPYGLTTIKATCEVVKANRSSPSGQRKDAVESFAGKTFTFTVTPGGKIEDYSQLDKLIREVGQDAFRPNTGEARTKDPDMIGDFVAAQWFLWDSVSSIKKAAQGVSVGETWKSKLSVPTPMVSRIARDVTYSLDEIRQTEKEHLAVIRSSYALSDSVPSGWPVPYHGSFQMAGQFGLLTDYKFLGLQGQGEELFNIDAGRIERYKQQYQMQVDASFPMGVSAKPHITIRQNLEMQLLGS